MMSAYGAYKTSVQFLSQTKPPITENNVPDLSGKVTIVTGSNTGLGKVLTKILYSKNAKVYMMARNGDKTREAIEDIRKEVPKSKGELIFIHLDLADLTTIRATAEEFLKKESQLHLLFNNAGVAFPPYGQKTKQGYELQLGVNCLGSFALTKLLTPTIVATAKTATPNSVRVLWVSSNAAECVYPKDFMRDLKNVDNLHLLGRYGISKLGNYLHATRFADRHKAEGVMSMSLNPGALDSDLWRQWSSIVVWLLRLTMFHPVVYGAYTCLFAAFSSEITPETSGRQIAPWGSLWDNKELEAASSDGTSEEFWTWSEEQIGKYL